MMTNDQWIMSNFACPNCGSQNMDHDFNKDPYGRYRYHCLDCGTVHDEVVGIIGYRIIEGPKNDIAYQIKEFEQSTCEGLLN